MAKTIPMPAPDFSSVRSEGRATPQSQLARPLGARGGGLSEKAVQCFRNILKWILACWFFVGSQALAGNGQEDKASILHVALIEQMYANESSPISSFSNSDYAIIKDTIMQQLKIQTGTKIEITRIQVMDCLGAETRRLTCFRDKIAKTAQFDDDYIAVAITTSQGEGAIAWVIDIFQKQEGSKYQAHSPFDKPEQGVNFLQCPINISISPPTSTDTTQLGRNVSTQIGKLLDHLYRNYGILTIIDQLQSKLKTQKTRNKKLVAFNMVFGLIGIAGGLVSLTTFTTGLNQPKCDLVNSQCHTIDGNMVTIPTTGNWTGSQRNDQILAWSTGAVALGSLTAMLIVDAWAFAR